MTDLTAAALRLAAFDLLEARVKDGKAAVKHALTEGMVVGDRKGVAVPVPGQEASAKVATITYAEGRSGGREAVVDHYPTFAEWAIRNAPEGAVEMEPRVADWFVAEALHRASRGEVIPGIEITETDAGRPYISIRRDKTPEAEALLVDAIFRDGATGLRSLLAIEAPGGEQ
jgi:hypothetical protein